MESLLQHYELPHEARQIHLGPQDTVPGLVKLPSTGHSSCWTVSNPLPAFSWRLVSPFSHPICRFAGSLGLFVGEWQMGPPQRTTAVTRSHHHTHGRQIKIPVYWLTGFFPRGEAFPAQQCCKTPMSPTNQPHQLCLRLTPGGWALFWCPPCRSAQSSGDTDPLSPPGWAPGANVCPQTWCCNAKHHPESAAFSDLTCLGQV